MRPGEALADIDLAGTELAERLLAELDVVRGGFGRARVDAAGHQLVWRHHMMTGEPAYGEAVIASLRAICRAPPAEARTLGGDAQLLELLTWVWRRHRCPELRCRADAIATAAVEYLRLPGAGIGGCGHESDGGWIGHAGLMLVALVEAGSVFERRDWLAFAREVYDAIVAAFAREGAGRLDDYATMSRAAVRLFEAFGKQRYLDQAQAWVATLDATFWDAARGRYRMRGADARRSSPLARVGAITDGATPAGNALMIGILARLHALTGTSRYADRAEEIVVAFRPSLARAGLDRATAVANVQTAARLVAIEVAGDPRLPETREMMRVALDCGLPDRLVLGPGAGGTPGEPPRARIRIGAQSLAPIEETARLRAMLAPGALADTV